VSQVGSAPTLSPGRPARRTPGHTLGRHTNQSSSFGPRRPFSAQPSSQHQIVWLVRWAAMVADAIALSSPVVRPWPTTRIPRFAGRPGRRSTDWACPASESNPSHVQRRIIAWAAKCIAGLFGAWPLGTVLRARLRFLTAKHERRIEPARPISLRLIFRSLLPLSGYARA
jgi:hypothetical protein